MDRIRIAKIVTAHGVKGLVKLQVFSQNPEILNDIALYIGKDSSESLKLQLKNRIGHGWIASVEGIHERNGAEGLRHTDLWMDRDKLEAANDGEYFIADLVGLTAVDASGKTIGTIKAVEDFGATPLLDIKPDKGASFYLPFTDECVPSLDIKKKIVVVSIPEGLL